MLRKIQSEIRIKEKRGSPEKREDGYEVLEKVDDAIDNNRSHGDEEANS